MKRLAVILLMLAMLVTSSACGSSGTEEKVTDEGAGQTDSGEMPEYSEPVVTLKFNHTDTAETTYHAAFLEMADAIKEYTKGYVEMQVYANGELAGERDSLEMMQMGTLDAGGVSSAPAGNFVKEMGILDAPFLYETDAHAYNVCTGEVKDYLVEKSREQGLHLLGFFCIGYRNMISKDPINTVEDFKGIKVRLMENDLHVATFEELGALPTTMAYSEVYTALQQGTIDAAENTNQNLFTQKYYEVCKYVALTGHFYCMKPVFISEKVFQELPAQYQTAIQEAFDSILLKQWKEAVQANDDFVAELEANGCTVVDFDKATLGEKVAAVYSDPRFADAMPAELVEMVKNTSKEW